MKKYNLGIIGLGNFGRFLISAYKKLPQVKIWAISDTNQETLKNVAKTENITNVYLDYADMLKDPNIDIALIRRCCDWAKWRWNVAITRWLAAVGSRSTRSCA